MLGPWTPPPTSARPARPPRPRPPRAPGPRRLRRRPDDGHIAGVCAGVAEYFNVDPVIVRIAAVVLLFSGPGAFAYVLAWIFVPAEPGLARYGEPQPPIDRKDRATQIFGIVLLVPRRQRDLGRLVGARPALAVPARAHGARRLAPAAPRSTTTTRPRSARPARRPRRCHRRRGVGVGRRRRDRDVDGTSPPTERRRPTDAPTHGPRRPMPSATLDDDHASSPPPTRRRRRRRRAPPPTAPWDVPPPPVPGDRSRRRRADRAAPPAPSAPAPRSVPIVFGVLLDLGRRRLAHRVSASTTGLAVGLVILGLGFVLGVLRRRQPRARSSRPSSWAPLLAVTAVIDIPFSGPIGEQHWSPAGVARAGGHATR